jgi:hypothetical protein
LGGANVGPFDDRLGERGPSSQRRRLPTGAHIDKAARVKGQ